MNEELVANCGEPTANTAVVVDSFLTCPILSSLDFI